MVQVRGEGMSISERITMLNALIVDRTYHPCKIICA